jgi:hypothetical protein
VLVAFGGVSRLMGVFRGHGTTHGQQTLLGGLRVLRYMMGEAPETSGKKDESQIDGEDDRRRRIYLHKGALLILVLAECLPISESN